MARKLGLQSGQFAFMKKSNRGYVQPRESTQDAGTLGGLTQSLQQERQQKYTSGLSNLSEVLKLFGPGYGKGMERTALAGVEEDLISRGLGSTTRPVAMSVGMKSEFEDMRRSRLAEALAMMAEYTQRSAPTPGLVSQTAQAANIALRQPGRLSPYMKKFDLKYGIQGGVNAGSFSTANSKLSRSNLHMI